MMSLKQQLVSSWASDGLDVEKLHTKVFIFNMMMMLMMMMVLMIMIMVMVMVTVMMMNRKLCSDVLL